MIKTLLKGQCGSNHVVPNSNFLKNIIKYLKQKNIGGFVRNLFRLLKGQYGTNRSVFDACFMNI